MRRFVVATATVATVLVGLLVGNPARAETVDHYRQGLLLLERHQYQPALDEFRIAVIDQPTNPDALCGLGVALYKLNALQEATEAFDRALSITSSALVQAQARGGLGDIYLQLGEHALAAAQYRTALAHNPQWVGARLNLARCLLALRELDAAGSELARLLHEQPRLPEAYQVHSELAVARGDLPMAHRDLTRAWSLGKDLGEASLAQTCTLAGRHGDYAGAAALLEHYGGKRTALYWATAGDTYYHWLMAIAPQLALGIDIPLARRMDPDALVTLARVAYERAILFQPDHPAARRALLSLGRLHGQSAIHLLTAPGMGGQTLRQDWQMAAATALAAGDRIQALHLGRLAAEGGSADDTARYVQLLAVTGS
ncbi:MAG: tetratricopeptide repeat protein, partial [Candidatus Sericytochromatia bacterium]|nr:tetratricopeptide repeat protein [Candidatus Sericytochromatia bacterium]